MKKINILSLVLIAYFISGCDQKQEPWIIAMEADNHTCPDGAMVEWHKWGKNGKAKSCKMKHGKFTGWENGKKTIEGYYEYGKKQGEWKWFNQEGKIIKIIIYKDNKEIETVNN